MDPRETFERADFVRLAEVSLDLVTPAVLPGGRATRTNVCVDKPAGQMRLVLNTQTDLSLAFDQDIVMEEQLPRPTGQPPLVNWKVDQATNVTLFPGTTIKRIKGSITTSFTEEPKSPGQACHDPAPHVVEVGFQTYGTDNNLDLTVDTALVGNWRAQNIRFIGGFAGEPTTIGTFDVLIRPRKSPDACRVWAREGKAVWFDAAITNLPPGAAVDIRWDIYGAPGGGTGSSTLVNLPSAGTEVTVAVAVTATQFGLSNTDFDKFTFTVLATDVADALEGACELRRMVKSYSLVNFLAKGSRNEIPGLVDPIWDEVPFFRTDGVALSAKSIRTFLASNDRLRVQLASVATSFDRVRTRTDQGHGTGRLATGEGRREEPSTE